MCRSTISSGSARPMPPARTSSSTTSPGSSFCRGKVDAPAMYEEIGIAVEGIDSLRRAIEALFAKHGPLRDRGQVTARLRPHPAVGGAQRRRGRRARWRHAGREELSEDERLCLGDWCMARGVEQAIAHNLPFKIHTGYYAGTGRHARRAHPSPAHLCALLTRYPQARFVLMHIAYPYSDELVAWPSTIPTSTSDICWAWCIDPYSACDSCGATSTPCRRTSSSPSAGTPGGRRRASPTQSRLARGFPGRWRPR